MNIIKQLQDYACGLIKLEEGGKEPLEGIRWSQHILKFDSPEIINHNGNIGIVAGCGGMVGIDLDIFTEKEAEKVRALSGRTLTVQTRSRKGYHFIYRSKERIENRNLVFGMVLKKSEFLYGKNKKKAIEVRAENMYIVAPNSFDKTSGNTYDVIDDCEISEITADRLSDVLRFYALLDSDQKLNDLYNGEWEKHYPGKTRSEAEQGFVTMLCQNGFGKDFIFRVMDCCCDIGKWSEKPESYKNLTYNKAVEFAKEHPLDVLPEKEPEEHIEYFRPYESYGIPEPPYWLMDGIIPERGITIITGAANVGKSFLAEEITSAIVNDRKVFGHFPIKHGCVVKIDMENEHGLWYMRLQNLGGVPADKLFVFNPAYDFNIEDEKMIHSLQECMANINPVAVVIDTFRSAYNGDENDSKTINRIFKNSLRPITSKTAVIILAHTRKGYNQSRADSDDMDAVRGTGDLVAKASAVIMLKKSLDGIIVKPIKMRQDRIPEPFSVKLIAEGDKFSFEYHAETKTSELLSDIELCTDSLFEWLKTNIKPSSEVETKDMIAAMQMAGHKKRNSGSAITALKNRGILHHIKKGHYRFAWGDDSLSNYL